MTKNKLWQAIKGLTLAAGMAVGIFALGQTDVLADTLTLTVEKNTIGQGMILDPVQVEFAKGETCADVLLRGLSENGITPLYKHEGYLHPPENEYPSLQKAFRKTVPDHSDKQDGDHLQELRSEPLCFPRVFFPEAPWEILPSDDDLWNIR